MGTDLQVNQEELQNLARDLGVDLRTTEGRQTAMIALKLGLDPLLGHIVLIPSQGGRKTPYITRDGLLHIAQRSGQLDGIIAEEPHLSPDGREWRCRVTVHRKDMAHPISYPGRFPAQGNKQAVQWGEEMATVRAEVHTLRRAFSVTGIAVYEEAGIEWGASVRAADVSQVASAAKQRQVAAALNRAGYKDAAACTEVLTTLLDREISHPGQITAEDVQPILEWCDTVIEGRRRAAEKPQEELEAGPGTTDTPE